MGVSNFEWFQIQDLSFIHRQSYNLMHRHWNFEGGADLLKVSNQN